MKTTTSLCFSHEGLINADALSFLTDREMDAVVLFSDGSEGAYDHIKRFNLNRLGNRVKRIGIGKTPLYEIRVINVDGNISKPHYVNSEEGRIKWICSKICANQIKISISDITSQSGTQVLLDSTQTELVCYLAHRLWSTLLVAEDRLCFPAVVIDRMTRWTYLLTPETIDIKALRQHVGLESLEYNSITDLLSVTVADDIFSVKLSVLNEFYGGFILPLFNKILGRRMRIRVSVIGSTGQACEPLDMSYGDLGRIVEEMRSSAKEKMISTRSPMDAQDLLAFAKKVRINEESCLWPADHQNVQDFILSVKDHLVRSVEGDNDLDQPDVGELIYESGTG